jgi:hypothetical protein
MSPNCMGNEIIRRVGPATADGTLRFLRIMHGCLMVSIALYGFAMRFVRPQTPALFTANTPVIFVVLAAGTISVALQLRSRFIGSASDVLRVRPDDAAALERWRKGIVASDVLTEAVALYGFALYFLGGQIWQAATLIVIAELLMVVWWPRRP